MRASRVGVLLMVLGLFALGAITGCGGGGSGETTAQLPASPAGKAEASNFDGVHSGTVEVALEVDRYKKKPEEINMRIIGSFLKAGEEPLPQFDLGVESTGDLAGRHVELIGGPYWTPEKWIASLNGKVYEPDHATFEELKSKFEAAQEEEGDEGNAMACIEAADGFAITDVVHHVSYEGKGEAIDGTKVETVGADLDTSAAIKTLIELSEGSPGCQAQLEAVGLPPAAQLEALEKELKGALTAARVTLSVDKHGVVRYFKVLANVELPRTEELEVELAMRLNQVNEVTEIPNPSGSSPFPALLKQFGLDLQDVKRADAGEIYVGVLEGLSDLLFGREGE